MSKILGPLNNVVKQWVESVESFSSEYPGWPASNVCGPSNTYPQYGDLKTAWAPSQATGTKEFLILRYRDFVTIQKIYIYETYNPGSVVKVSCRSKNGDWETLWEKTDGRDNSLPPVARIFSPPLKKSSFPTNVVRIDLDCIGAQSYSQIDAIEIEGILEEFYFDLPIDQSSMISNAIANLFNNPMFSDITFCIGDEKLFAHKNIIYGVSPTFGKMIENVSTFIVKDWNFEIFETMMKFIYTGKCIIQGKNVDHLLLCSDKFGVSELRAACFKYLVKLLNKDSVSNIILKAKRKEFNFDATDLISACLEFLANKTYQIISTEGFFQFDLDILLEMIQKDNLVVDEDDLFDAIIKWGEYQIQNREEYKTLKQVVEPLMKHIRYPLIEPNKLVNHIKFTKLVPFNLYIQALEYHAEGGKIPEGEENNPQFKPRAKMFKGTTLLNCEQSQQILNWLGKDYLNSKWEILYKATIDGFTAASFHQKCDHKGETIVLIQSSEGYLFGGYNPDDWTMNSRYGTSPNSFLFSLKNKDGKGMIKIPKIQGKNGCYGSASYGPTFGGGHDLYICSNSNTIRSSYTNLGNSFDSTTIGPNYNYGSQNAKNFLAGNYNFITSEIEIFGRVKDEE